MLVWIGIAPGLFGVAAGWGDGEGVFGGEAEDCGDLLGVGWGDGELVVLLMDVIGAGDAGQLIDDVGGYGHPWTSCEPTLASRRWGTRFCG